MAVTDSTGSGGRGVSMESKDQNFFAFFSFLFRILLSSLMPFCPPSARSIRSATHWLRTCGFCCVLVIAGLVLVLLGFADGRVKGCCAFCCRSWCHPFVADWSVVCSGVCPNALPDGRFFCRCCLSHCFDLLAPLALLVACCATECSAAASRAAACWGGACDGGGQPQITLTTLITLILIRGCLYRTCELPRQVWWHRRCGKSCFVARRYGWTTPAATYRDYVQRKVDQGGKSQRSGLVGNLIRAGGTTGASAPSSEGPGVSGPRSAEGFPSGGGDISFQFFVRSTTGRLITVRMRHADSVGSLWQQIMQKDVSHGSDHPLRLVFASRQLEEERAISDYNITPGCTVHIMGRLRGGARTNKQCGPRALSFHGYLERCGKMTEGNVYGCSSKEAMQHFERGEAFSAYQFVRSDGMWWSQPCHAASLPIGVMSRQGWLQRITRVGLICLKGAMWQQDGHRPQPNQILVRIDVSANACGSGFTATQETVTYCEATSSLGELGTSAAHTGITVEGTMNQAVEAVKSIGGTRSSKRKAGGGWVSLRADAPVAQLEGMPAGMLWYRGDRKMESGVSVFVEETNWVEIRDAIAGNPQWAGQVIRESPRWAAIGGDPDEIVRFLQKLRQEGVLTADLCYRQWWAHSGDITVALGRVGITEELEVAIDDSRITTEAVAAVTQVVIGKDAAVEVRMVARYVKPDETTNESTIEGPRRVAKVRVPKRSRKLLCGMSYDFEWRGEELRVQYVDCQGTGREERLEKRAAGTPGKDAKKGGGKRKAVTPAKDAKQQIKRERRGADGGQECESDGSMEEDASSFATADEETGMEENWQAGQLITAELFAQSGGTSERTMLKVVGPEEGGDAWIVEPAEGEGVDVKIRKTAVNGNQYWQITHPDAKKAGLPCETKSFAFSKKDGADEAAEAKAREEAAKWQRRIAAAKRGTLLKREGDDNQYMDDAEEPRYSGDIYVRARICGELEKEARALRRDAATGKEIQSRRRDAQINTKHTKQSTSGEARERERATGGADPANFIQ